MISAIFYLLGATALLISANTSLDADLQGRCIHPAQPFIGLPFPCSLLELLARTVL